MIHEQENMRIFWKKTKKLEACILRVLGTVPHACIPAYIGDFPVTELASRCFAKNSEPFRHYLASDPAGKNDADNHRFYVTAGFYTELCGSYIESIILPHTLERIGDYAFYDCRNLVSLQFSNSLRTIGSDAFMNCTHLHKLQIRCGALDPSGLPWILGQISWDVETVFLSRSPEKPLHTQAAVFYPEYYEVYDEIAPAHIFGRKIIGEGFRARQCFQNSIIDYSSYDNIFEKACAEESARTLCHMALCRLRYPVMLSGERKSLYENYIRQHTDEVCQNLVKGKQLDMLGFLFQNKLLSAQAAQTAASSAAAAGWGEGSANILRWKQTFYSAEKQAKYDFEDF